MRVATGSAERAAHLCEVVFELVRRDMRLRYKTAATGVFWSLLNPLAQVMVFAFVFTRAIPVRVPHFPAFLLCGLLSWNWLQTSLTMGTECFTQNRELVRRPAFWPAVLPLARVSADMVHFLLALPLLLVLALATGCRWGPSLTALPLVIALQFLFTLGGVYLLGTSQVTFTDTRHLLGVFLMLAFYLTPVFYDAALLSEPYRSLYALNPVADLLEAYRAILLGGTWPPAAVWLVIIAWTVVLLAIGLSAYRAASRHFAEEL